MEREIKQLIVDYVIAHKGNWNDIMVAIEKKEEVAPQNYEGNVMTILDNNYPESFRHYFKPPFAFFYEGDIALLKADTRLCVRSIKNTHKYMSKEEMDAIVDAIIDAHADAYIVNLNDEFLPLLLKKDVKLIVVSDKSYDLVAENADLRQVLANGGLFITEIPNGVVCDQLDTKHQASRLMAVLETKLIVASSKSYSSVNMGISFSTYFGHDVVVAPLSLGTKELNNNEYIRDGAYILGGYDFTQER